MPTRSGTSPTSPTSPSAIALRDPDRLNRFLAEESGRLFDFAGRVIRYRLGRVDHELAESLTQDAMLKFATWARSGKLAEKLGTKDPARYLCGLCDLTLKEVLRQRDSRATHLTPEMSDEHGAKAIRHAFVEDEAASHLRERLARCIDRLSDFQRLVITTRTSVPKGEPPREAKAIADQLGNTADNVRTALKAARAQIQRCLDTTTTPRPGAASHERRPAR